MTQLDLQDYDFFMIPNQAGKVLSKEEWDFFKSKVDKYFSLDRITFKKEEIKVDLELVQSYFQHVSSRLKDNPGYLYLLKNKSGNYKVGLSKSLPRRIQNLQTGNDFKLELISLTVVKDMKTIEDFIHEKFRRVRLSGEWFSLDVESVGIIKELLKLLYFRVKSP